MNSAKAAMVLLGLLALAGSARAGRVAVVASAAATACSLDSECSPEEFCDVDAGCSPKLKDMRMCERDGQCVSGACRIIGFLGPLKTICVHSCANSTECPAKIPICVKAKKPSADKNAAPAASTGKGMCAECQVDADCADPSKYCVFGWSPDVYTCADLGPACTTTLDCGPGSFCDKTAKRCKRWSALA